MKEESKYFTGFIKRFDMRSKKSMTAVHSPVAKRILNKTKQFEQTELIKEPKLKIKVR